MKHAVAVSGAVCFALFLLAGCGGPTTPDTEGQTLTQARQALVDSGVPQQNITVVGQRGDPDELYVCDQDPDGVAPTEPVNLEVATACVEEDDSRKKKRPKIRRRR
ncbi:MAG: hypothetical protein M3Q49_16700 [Actinomycetota bacterium]|nr:hypothetical protein [Actinomycetota bacterium]